MNTYQKALIDEHSELFNRINKLHNHIFGDNCNTDNKVEFANKCIQLAAMRKYEEALSSRLENAGIYFDEGEYLEKVASVERKIERRCLTKHSGECNCESNDDIELAPDGEDVKDDE